MRPRNLDIDLLRSFTAVVDTGSFTAAAELVALTQSAVSVQIKRLEEALGRKVFERSSRALALTPEGEVLLGYARRILQLNDDSLRHIAEPPMTGKVRLGVTEYFVPQELPRILARFGAAYPGVHLEVRMGLSGDLQQELAKGRLDAAIVRIGPRETVKMIWSEPQHWVAREGLALEEEGVVPLVVLRAPCVLREFAIDALRRSRRAWRIAFTGSSMASVHAAVVAGLGVSIMPASLLLPGITVLSDRRDYPDPGRLQVGVRKRPGARADIVAALEGVVRQTLSVLAASRLALPA